MRNEAVQLSQFHYMEAFPHILCFSYKNGGKRCVLWTGELREKCSASVSPLHPEQTFLSPNTLYPQHHLFSPTSLPPRASVPFWKLNPPAPHGLFISVLYKDTALLQLAESCLCIAFVPSSCCLVLLNSPHLSAGGNLGSFLFCPGTSFVTKLAEV